MYLNAAPDLIGSGQIQIAFIQQSMHVILHSYL